MDCRALRIVVNEAVANARKYRRAGTPIECRENEKQPFRPGSAEDMVVDLRQRMETVGTPHAPSRCGAPTPIARAPRRSLPAAR